MEHFRGFGRVFLIIFLLAAPATSVHIASYFSDDPYLRPLDLTVEKLDAVGERRDGVAYIDVDLYWGRDRQSRQSRADLVDSISSSLRWQTDFFTVKVHETEGSRAGVAFNVGPNRYGPYPPARVAEGLDLALEAMRMTNAQLQAQ